MIPLGNIIRKHGVSFHCYDAQLYVSANPDERQQLNKTEGCVKDIRYYILINYLLLNSDKTDVLALGIHEARSKLSDYTVTQVGLSISSCATVKDLGVIIDFSPLFEAYVDNISRIDFFHLRNIAMIENVMPPHEAFVTSWIAYCNTLL